jgi:hypothetical protein
MYLNSDANSLIHNVVSLICLYMLHYSSWAVAGARILKVQIIKISLLNLQYQCGNIRSRNQKIHRATLGNLSNYRIIKTGKNEKSYPKSKKNCGLKNMVWKRWVSIPVPRAYRAGAALVPFRQAGSRMVTRALYGQCGTLRTDGGAKSLRRA